MFALIVRKDECRWCVFEEGDLDAGIATWGHWEKNMGFADLAFFNEGHAILRDPVDVVDDDNGDLHDG